MLDAILSFFKPRTAPCACGGTFRERLSWAGEHFQCADCGITVSEEVFEAKAQRQRAPLVAHAALK